jgi:hypothetical protein
MTNLLPVLRRTITPLRSLAALCALLVFGAGCASTAPTTRVQDGVGTQAYRADFKTVIEAAAQAANKAGLDVDGGSSPDAVTYIIACAKRETGGSTVGYNNTGEGIQTAAVEIVVKKALNGPYTYVEVELTQGSSRDSGGLTSSLDTSPEVYVQRIFDQLDKQFPIAQPGAEGEVETPSEG